MSKKSKRRSDDSEPGAPLVTVCRGCCCGNRAKHPNTDPAGQIARLRAVLAGTDVRVRVTDCLDACEHSNVVIVSPSAAGRKAGGRPVWLGEVLDMEPVEEIVRWVLSGGPGITDPPGTLDLHGFSPSRRVRDAGERTG